MKPTLHKRLATFFFIAVCLLSFSLLAQEVLSGHYELSTQEPFETKSRGSAWPGPL